MTCSYFVITNSLLLTSLGQPVRLWIREWPNYNLASLVAQTVKGLSTMQETRVRSLGREDPLEKEMEVHSSTIAWKIPWTEELGRLQSMGSQRVRHNWATSLNYNLRKWTYGHIKNKWNDRYVGRQTYR